MKYSLRSLMIVVLVLPPLLAVGWKAVERIADRPELGHDHEFERVYPGGPFKCVDWQAAMEKDDAIFGQYARARFMPNSQAPVPNPPKE